MIEDGFAAGVKSSRLIVRARLRRPLARRELAYPVSANPKTCAARCLRARDHHRAPFPVSSFPCGPSMARSNASARENGSVASQRHLVHRLTIRWPRRRPARRSRWSPSPANALRRPAPLWPWAEKTLTLCSSPPREAHCATRIVEASRLPPRLPRHHPGESSALANDSFLPSSRYTRFSFPASFIGRSLKRPPPPLLKDRRRREADSTTFWICFVGLIHPVRARTPCRH